MDWRDAVTKSGICNDAGVKNMESGDWIPITATEIQSIIDIAASAERERCAEIAAKLAERIREG